MICLYIQAADPIYFFASTSLLIGTIARVKYQFCRNTFQSIALPGTRLQFYILLS